MKRKRRVEITRYSRRITVICGDDAVTAYLVAQESDADIVLRPEGAPFVLDMLEGSAGAVKAAARKPLGLRLLGFFAWLRRED